MHHTFSVYFLSRPTWILHYTRNLHMQELIALLKKLLRTGQIFIHQWYITENQNSICWSPKCDMLCRTVYSSTIYNTAVLFYHSYVCVHHTVTSAFTGYRSVYTVQSRYRLKSWNLFFHKQGFLFFLVM